LKFKSGVMTYEKGKGGMGRHKGLHDVI